MTDILTEIQGVKADVIAIKNEHIELIKYLLERFPPQVKSEILSIPSEVKQPNDERQRILDIAKQKGYTHILCHKGPKSELEWTKFVIDFKKGRFVYASKSYKHPYLAHREFLRYDPLGHVTYLRNCAFWKEGLPETPGYDSPLRFRVALK